MKKIITKIIAVLAMLPTIALLFVIFAYDKETNSLSWVNLGIWFCIAAAVAAFFWGAIVLFTKR